MLARYHTVLLDTCTTFAHK